jgi:hypothetical protein
MAFCRAASELALMSAVPAEWLQVGHARAAGVYARLTVRAPSAKLSVPKPIMVLSSVGGFCQTIVVQTRSVK